jgi:hypothetical protein
LKIAIEDIREGVSTLELVCRAEEIGLESEGIKENAIATWNPKKSGVPDLENLFQAF